jgi:hypothetical protein
MEKFLVGLFGGVLLALFGVTLVAFGFYAVDKWGGLGLIGYIMLCVGLGCGFANMKEDKK